MITTCAWLLGPFSRREVDIIAGSDFPAIHMPTWTFFVLDVPLYSEMPLYFDAVPMRGPQLGSSCKCCPTTVAAQPLHPSHNNVLVPPDISVQLALPSAPSLTSTKTTACGLPMLTGAFERVNRDLLWEILRRRGGRVLAAVQSLNANCSVAMNTSGRVGYSLCYGAKLGQSLPTEPYVVSAVLRWAAVIAICSCCALLLGHSWAVGIVCVVWDS